MERRVSIEVAVETLVSAVAAAQGGAHRLELCSELSLHGGLTPSEALTEAVFAAVEIPIFAMIRPRPGDFVYSASEIAVLCESIEDHGVLGVHGIVTGCLTPDNHIDRDVLRTLCDAADPLEVTFHRAFDRTPNLPESLDVLIECGVTRVLTSGGQDSALAGADMLRELVRQAAGRIEILAGGGVRESNVAELIRATGVREVHTKLKDRADEEVDAVRMARFARAVGASLTDHV